MSTTPSQTTAEAKNSAWRELELTFQAGWKIVLACVAVAIVLAVLALRSAIYTYPVQMQVMAVQSSSDDGGSKLSQLSSLAALANVSLPTTPNAMQFRFYLDAFASRDLADHIAENQEMMKILFANQWDPVNKVWREPPKSAIQVVIGGIRSFLGLAPAIPWQPPSGAAVQSFLNDNIDVQQDPRKPYLAKVTLTTSNRTFGVEFLRFLNSEIDSFLRQKALRRAQAYIAYLSAKAQTVTVAEHRMAIVQALSDQERYSMVANSGTPFAAEVFEHPWVSNLPSSPQPRQAFLVYIAIGFAVGMALAHLKRKYGSKLPIAAWLKRLPTMARSTSGL